MTWSPSSFPQEVEVGTTQMPNIEKAIIYTKRSMSIITNIYIDADKFFCCLFCPTDYTSPLITYCVYFHYWVWLETNSMKNHQPTTCNFRELTFCFLHFTLVHLNQCWPSWCTGAFILWHS